ncbi:uncharacterized protein UTRI_03033 [Ustilago trichophora]|uniref:Uncharacterized protein n=1 Tax=Ustilago trichophora TaxID=86804 RepID=A0A5C3E5G7_9BASI|nr:uncharacterized protein UTRI_03033 [Ustilago trichophora]
MRSNWRYWVARIGIDNVPTSKMFPVIEKGSEVRAAICYDIWRLKLVSHFVTINFERMRPVYLALIARYGDSNKDLERMIEKAYVRLGGDAFAQTAAADTDEDADNDGEVTTTESPTAESSVAIQQAESSGSSSHPIIVDSDNSIAAPLSGPVRSPSPVIISVKLGKRKSP